MDPEVAPSHGTPRDRSAEVGIALLVCTCLVLGAYASFVVPLLRGGLAAAPMVTLADSSALFGDFSATTGLDGVPEPLATGIYLFWFATIAIGPLFAGTGLLVSGYLAARELADSRPIRAAIDLLSCLGCAAVLAWIVSPWGHTAKAWFFD